MLFLYAYAAGKAYSPQCQALLEYKEQLAGSLADGPDQHLLNQFKLRGWLGERAYRSAPELNVVGKCEPRFALCVHPLPTCIVEKRDPGPLQQDFPLSECGCLLTLGACAVRVTGTWFVSVCVCPYVCLSVCLSVCYHVFCHHIVRH